MTYPKGARRYAEPMVGVDEFVAYGVGLVYASACTSLDDEAATIRINHQHPTGIASPWRVSDDPSFADGSPNPQPCPDSATHRHVLFSC